MCGVFAASSLCDTMEVDLKEITVESLVFAPGNRFLLVGCSGGYLKVLDTSFMMLSFLWKGRGRDLWWMFVFVRMDRNDGCLQVDMC